MTTDTGIDMDRDAAQLVLFEASRARLFSLAYRILGVRAEAEDVVQDTFVKWHLHQRSAGVTADDALDTPAAWLATVAKRTAIDRLRRLKHETLWPADSEMFDGSFDAADHAPSAQALAERTLTLEYGLRLMLDRLSAEEQVAFLMREAFEADYASIAKILNRSAAHCRQMVHRAKDRVRDDKRNPDSTTRHNATDAIEPLLDAIARQDVGAMLALTMTTVSGLGSATPTSMSASAEQQAAIVTRAVIARLRMGRIELPSSAAREHVARVRITQLEFC